MSFLDNFVLLAILTGLGVSMLTGPIGCFIVWRRLAYFSDALSHSSLLGLALAFTIGFNLDISIILVCFLFSILLFGLEHQGHLKADSYLGILANSGLALGIVALSLQNVRQADLHSYLFGDIFLTNWQDVFKIFLVALAANFMLALICRPLLRLTLNSDLAEVEGVNKLVTRLIFFLIVSIGIGTSMRIVGILLINAMLIIPPSSASLIAKSPLRMAVFACIFEFFSILAGITVSFWFDLPSSAAIVFCMLVLFILLSLYRLVLNKLAFRY